MVFKNNLSAAANASGFWVAPRNNKRLLFLGATQKPEAFASADKLFLNTMRGLHSLSAEEKRIALDRGAGARVRLVQVKAGESFVMLAKQSSLGKDSESILRLINNKFPDGEPSAGVLIKIIQ